MQSLEEQKQSRNYQEEEKGSSCLNLGFACHEKPSLNDFECPVCFEVMVEPVKLMCSHLFCSVCLKNNHKHHFQICPMCRKTLKKQNNGEVVQEMVNDLKLFFPAEYQA